MGLSTHKDILNCTKTFTLIWAEFTNFYVGKDEKGLIHVLAGDKKTSLKQVSNRGYDTFENDIDAALDECEEMIYSCISSASRIGW